MIILIGSLLYIGWLCIRISCILLIALYNGLQQFSLVACRPLGRKRSSVDLGANYPGDLLLRERQKKQLIKRNTIADFAATRSYHASTTSLISEQGSVSQGTPYNCTPFIHTVVYVSSPLLFHCRTAVTSVVWPVEDNIETYCSYVILMPRDHASSCDARVTDRWHCGIAPSLSIFISVLCCEYYADMFQ